MNNYTVEIKGKPLVALNANSFEDAEEKAYSNWLAEDLTCLTTEDDFPLWDGKSREDIFVRPSHPEEIATWEVSHAKAVQAGNADPRDEDWLVFLVPVIDPTDYEDEEEDEDE